MAQVQCPNCGGYKVKWEEEPVKVYEHVSSGCRIAWAIFLLASAALIFVAALISPWEWCGDCFVLRPLHYSGY